MSQKWAGTHHRRNSLCILIATAFVIPGCAVDPKTGQPSLKETFASDDPCSNNARNIGILAGVVGGAILGKQLSKGNKGVLIGAGTGAALGGMIGHHMDARRCEIARLSKQYGMTVAITPINGPLPSNAAPSTAAASGGAAAGSAAGVGPSAASFSNASGMTISVLDNNQQFAPDSARLEPKAAEYFSKVAAQYSYSQQSGLLANNSAASKQQKDDVESLKKRRILLIGHTDDTGSSARNAELSEARAKTVGEVFKAAGVSDLQIFYQGAGETLPVGDNRTSEGRARNRRVEIVDLSDEAAFVNYLATRRPTLAYYRPAAASSTGAVPQSQPKAATSREASKTAERGDTPTPPSGHKTVTTTNAATAAGRDRPVSPIGNTPTGVAATDAKATKPLFDFGGAPARGSRGVDVGALLPEKAGLSLISTTYAAGADVPPSCADDRPRASRGVKSLRDQKDISFTELMPGLYGSTWSDTVNGNLVAVTNVTVYRDGAQPAAKPTVLVYRDFNGNRNAKADMRQEGEVNTYRGDKALLYRVFLDGPVKCMDVVLPYAGAQRALDSQLLYPRNAELYVAGFKPSIATH